MKRTTRLIAAMLCIMLAFGCLAPASAAAAKLLQTGGSFYLTASTATATIIEPVRVDYAHGQTVKKLFKQADTRSAALKAASSPQLTVSGVISSDFMIMTNQPVNADTILMRPLPT